MLICVLCFKMHNKHYFIYEYCIIYSVYKVFPSYWLDGTSKRHFVCSDFCTAIVCGIKIESVLVAPGQFLPMNSYCNEIGLKLENGSRNGFEESLLDYQRIGRAAQLEKYLFF